MAQSTERIINGKIYDIETARYLGQWDNGLYYGADLEWLCITLYRNEDGDCFLYVEGNDEEELREQYGEHFYDSEIILPMTEEKAWEWALCHLSTDQNLRIFGVACKSRKQVSAWIEKDIVKRANAFMHDTGCTIQDIFAAGVEALEKRLSE